MGIPEKSFLNSELAGNAAEKIRFIIQSSRQSYFYIIRVSREKYGSSMALNCSLSTFMILRFSQMLLGLRDAFGWWQCDLIMYLLNFTLNRHIKNQRELLYFRSNLLISLPRASQSPMHFQSNSVLKHRFHSSRLFEVARVCWLLCGFAISPIIAPFPIG